ncbi:MAG: DUF2961 domain-containing protein [Fimbriimonas sp.]|nr:DUF2961 domain-containing protein [Fimbriimonas sp.]
MKILSLAILVSLSAPVLAQEVSVRSLLPQMTDLTFLTHRPSPRFKMAQASSYDRRSDPGPNSDPFANGDAGNFVRVENTTAGKEYVMADLKGPGAVVRLWSANPSGNLRFYFDGETTPRIKVKMSEFLTGKIAPLEMPFAYAAASGCDVYFPFPYARSLKITADAADGGQPTSLYYHVGYRTYAPSAKVKTFTWDEFAANKPLMDKVATGLIHADIPEMKTIAHGMVGTGGALVGTVTQPISSSFRTFQVKIPTITPEESKSLDWDDPKQPHNVLRNLLLSMSFDNEPCIEAPLGDFFGSAPGLNPYTNVPMTVAADGTLTCRFVMPFQHTASIRIENLGPAIPVTVNAEIKPFPWSAGTYHFHAQWLGEHARTRPFRDMPFLDVKGEGYFVGTNLHVANPAPDWWGEGDEKARVDGESFPSTFGTGSEDYYGYAWGSGELFIRPYHAQTRMDGPGSMGHTSLNRWQIFDPIPYSTSLIFTLEMWHWADVVATYVHTTYWYALPGGTGPAAIDRTILAPPKIEPMKPVPGALEGEALEIASKTGGVTEVQDGFWKCSGGKQLWWRDAQTGDKLVLKIPVSEDGTYEIVGNFCQARDYGIHKIKVNGKEVAPIDFFSPDLDWNKHTLGLFSLAKGTALLEIECMGHHEGADPHNMFGLDYLLLKKI